MVNNIETFTKVVLLGILEGLTEFIPVSSTGHLILLGDLLEFTGPKADTFSIFIQLGAILAVVLLYWSRFTQLLPGSKTQSGFSGLLGISKLTVACLPAFILGFLFREIIKGALFSPVPVAAALITGGVLMFMVENRSKPVAVEKLEDLSLSQCFWIGVFQGLALWPGVSRSGSTIIGAMLLGCHRKIAAEFSFLVAVPVMFAAVGYDLLESSASLGRADLPVFAAGFVVSFITAFFAIKFFLSILGRYSLKPFGYYRIALGMIVLGFLL